MKKAILVLGMVALTLGIHGLSANETNGSETTIAHSRISKMDIHSFCKAVIQGDLTTVKRLLALGEDVNQKSLGMTPAMYAARYAKTEVLKVLLLNGANLYIKSDKGYTAKEYATMSNALAVLEVIDANS